MQQNRVCGRSDRKKERKKGLNNGHMEGKHKRTYQLTEAQKIQERGITGGE